MDRQLVLLDNSDAEPDWKLDEHTRQIGKRGVAAARAALAEAARRHPEYEADRTHAA